MTEHFDIDIQCTIFDSQVAWALTMFLVAILVNCNESILKMTKMIMMTQMIMMTVAIRDERMTIGTVCK